MQYTAPHYYKKFKCIADKCPDTCCAGWQIIIDNKTMKKYKSIKGDVGKRLKKEIIKKEQRFNQYEKRCAFLNNDNLCDLVLAGGDEYLCRTCRMFPREIEEYDGLREISLSLACPVVADMLMDMDEKVTFIHREGKDLGEHDDDFDFIFFTKLEDTRDLMLKIIQNRDYPVSVRMAVVLSLGHDVEERTKRNRMFEVDELLERYSDKEVFKYFAKKLEEVKKAGNQDSVLKDIFDIIDSIEVLKKSWRPYISDIESTLFEEKEYADTKALGKWLELMEVPMEQLMVYYIYKFFCPAVYDGLVYIRTKFAVISSILIKEMTKAVLLKHKILYDKENIRMFKESCRDILSDAARRYSKEVEHSDDNLEFIRSVLKDEERFGMQEILSIL